MKIQKTHHTALRMSEETKDICKRDFGSVQKAFDFLFSVYLQLIAKHNIEESTEKKENK